MPLNNLQKLIKQNKPFPNEYLKAEVGLLYTCNQMNAAFQELLKEFGITQQQYNVLRILRGQHPKSANVNMIRDRMLDKMSDASRIVERLVKSDFVIKQTDEIDKRLANVTITSKALNLLSKLDEIINDRKTLLSKLSESEIEQFNSLINKMLS